MQKRIISIHPRKQHNFEQAAELSKHYGDNFSHLTSIYFSQNILKFVGMFSPKIKRFLAKRSHPNLDSRFVQNYPLTAFKFLLKKLLGQYYSYYMQNIDFQNEIINKISNPPEICISFDGFSEILFQEWKGRSFLILDLTIALPQYFLKTQTGDDFRSEILAEMDEFHKRIFKNALIEIEYADLILCGSQFVKDSVRYFKPDCEDKCIVLPYGVNHLTFGNPNRNFDNIKIFKFVFVGTVDTRKGADLLLKAWIKFSNQNSDVELHFFGDVHLDLSKFQELKNIFFHGRVNQKELSIALKQMNVFILPSLHEGSSIAIYQAMASQLPIITTYNSGTVLKHMESCLMIEPKLEDINSAMEILINNKILRDELAKEAYRLSLKFTWENYGITLKNIITNGSR